MDAPGATEALENVPQNYPENSSPTAPSTQQRPVPHVHTESGVNDDHDDDHDEEEEEEEEEGGKESVTETGSEHEDGDGDYDDDEDEEPHLKYAYVTKQLGSVYRNGDATSTFLAAGDKMVIGTHNGNIHVFSVPLLRPLRVYHAHSATITSISMSPFPPPLPSLRQELASRYAHDQGQPAKPSSSSGSIRGQSKATSQIALPATPSNSIYIASSSIDGNVCVASLLDKKDVLLRNFGRPVQAVALSPEYKSDRTFVSGGRAGELTLTTGGKVGVSTNSTTMGGAAATASSWLGTLGLGGNTGKDTVLHSGEGAISTVKWSISGKYVAWVNEEGIKIMRSNLYLDTADSEFAWKRVSHTDRPNRPGWEEMASVWKARIEWVGDDLLEHEQSPDKKAGGLRDDPAPPTGLTVVKERLEKLVVGWGGTVWVINVYPDRPSKSNQGKNIGSVEIATILRTDCIISGISMYSPSLLAVLAYMELEEDPTSEQVARRRGRGQEPELRIIDIDSKEQISADTLSVSRFQNLTASDYHMCVLPPWKAGPVSQRGALGTIGTGLWDATTYPARLFSSAASIRSSTSSGDRNSSRAPSTFASRHLTSEEPLPTEVQEIAESIGPRIFLHGPYDSVVALKRDLTDRLLWLNEHGKYEEAWNLLDEHPEAAGSLHEAGDNISILPGRSQTSLGDLFPDDRSSITATDRGAITAPEQEKRRIGELWIEQLVKDDRWQEAAEVCVKALAAAHRWEHWAWEFIKKDRFDEISSVIPVDLRPPLSSEIYEAILEHYLTHDRQKFSELIDTWPFDLFDVDTIVAAVEACIGAEKLTPELEDGRVLMRGLAKLYLAGGHYSDALRCYIRLQDADTALALVKAHRLLDALSDDIPAFIMIRVSKQQLKSAPISELAEITAEPIRLLVSEAHTGIVSPATVLRQLQTSNRPLFLFFYLRALWRGESLSHGEEKPRRGRYSRDAATKLAADEGKNLVDQFADTAADLFAQYDRPLLMEFLQTSTAYSFDIAVTICEQYRFTPELIYLLSKMGQTKRALNLILSELKDVSQAISFVKSQDDPDLWEDLVDYSMDKPRFIHGLLVEAGTSLDPIKLVRRIPSGLEIEGLREGLTGLLREHDLQASISQGAARVLQSEVAINMNTLRRGQRRGIKFDIVENPPKAQSKPDGEQQGGEADLDTPTPLSNPTAPKAGSCGGCHRPFNANEKEILVAFACGHAFHLSHVHQSEPTSPTTPGSQSGTQTPRPFPPSRTLTLDELSSTTSRTVGPKVTTARLLRDRIGDGCRICALAKELESIGDSET